MKSTKALTKKPAPSNPIQNSKAHSSQSKEFLKNYFKLQGRVTFDELINTYGKTQDIKPSAVIAERSSSRKGSRDNIKILKSEPTHHKKVNYP